VRPSARLGVAEPPSSYAKERMPLQPTRFATALVRHYQSCSDARHAGGTFRLSWARLKIACSHLSCFSAARPWGDRNSPCDALTETTLHVAKSSAPTRVASAQL
jgi:hypothetical protein